MIRLIILYTTLIGFLTGFNILIINLVSVHSFLYLILFLGNVIFVSIISFLTTNTKTLPDDSKLSNNNTVSEESISVFIKVLIYTLPIVALIGLYFISILNNGKILGIEDANSWVSFILGIAAFTMALVTLWQSEWTYTKIFNALDKLKEDTNAIKERTMVKEMYRDINFELNKNSEKMGQPEQPESQDQPEILMNDAVRDKLAPREGK